MKKKIYQLVHHDLGSFQYYAIHEALIEKGEIYWVGSNPIRTYNTYSTAVADWVKLEPTSCFRDIMEEEDAEKLYDKVEYDDIEELDFDK